MRARQQNVCFYPIFHKKDERGKKRGLEKSGQRRRMSWRHGKTRGGETQERQPKQGGCNGTVRMEMPGNERGDRGELDSTNLQCGECL